MVCVAWSVWSKGLSKGPQGHPSFARSSVSLLAASAVVARAAAALAALAAPPPPMAALKPGEAGYRTALLLSCAFFMVCSAGMMVFNKIDGAARRAAAEVPITIS